MEGKYYYILLLIAHLAEREYGLRANTYIVNTKKYLSHTFRSVAYTKVNDDPADHVAPKERPHDAAEVLDAGGLAQKANAAKNL